MNENESLHSARAHLTYFDLPLSDGYTYSLYDEMMYDMHMHHDLL